MPTIDVDYSELQRLLNINLECNMEKLDNILAYVKAEVKGYDEKDGSVSIEMKDTARADLWSVEGLARALRGYIGKTKGIKPYSLGESDVQVYVDACLSSIRPYISCATVKNIHLSDNVIKGIMHLQDKLDQTHGRSRQKTSIGIYNLDLIKPPIQYKAVKPSEVSFIPLGFEVPMGLDEIIEKHPKGVEYGHIVKRNPLYPILFDSGGKVLSFPPIINSNDLGKITEASQNLLVEVTGTQHNAVLNTLKLVTLALIDRGGSAYSTTIHYPEGKGYCEGTVVTPDFSNRCFKLSVTETNRLLGLELSAKEIMDLLSVSGLDVESADTEVLSVLVPCYRIDIMHQVDIIEDVAIAYGYNNIKPLWRELPTTGKAKADQHQIDLARDLMVGLGYQEILNTTLSNQETLHQKMNLPPAIAVELANPKVNTMTCIRNWLLTSLMEFLSINQSVEFPQKVFELGKVTLPDATAETRTRDEDWIAATTSHPNANFTEIKSALDSVLNNLGFKWQIAETTHPSFIEGRVGAVKVEGVEVGVVGEVHPMVLEAWKLETPVAAFEVNYQKVLSIKPKK